MYFKRGKKIIFFLSNRPFFDPQKTRGGNLLTNFANSKGVIMKISGIVAKEPANPFWRGESSEEGLPQRALQEMGKKKNLETRITLRRKKRRKKERPDKD
jgi:hypothetical protein